MIILFQHDSRFGRLTCTVEIDRAGAADEIYTAELPDGVDVMDRLNDADIDAIMEAASDWADCEHCWDGRAGKAAGVRWVRERRTVEIESPAGYWERLAV